MQDMNVSEMQQVDGGGWWAVAGLYVGVAALAVTCAPVAAGMAVGGLVLGAIDLMTE